MGASPEPAAAPMMAGAAAPGESLETTVLRQEVATAVELVPSPVASPTDFAARVDEELGARRAVPSAKLESREAAGAANEAKALRAEAAPPAPTLADYQIAMAAALRAAEAGRYDLAADGFALVRRGVPDEPLAREAEYQERLAGYRRALAEGEPASDLLVRAARAADESWNLVAAAGAVPAVTCRRALADLRAWLTLAREIDPAGPTGEAESRLSRLRDCAR
jgi:hypothetical protein